MKDTKHIRRDFHSVAWVMPQGWNFWALGVPRGVEKYFFQTWSCGISNWQGWRAEQNASTIFYPRVKLVTLEWGQKVKYYILTTMSILRFFYQTLCAFLQIKDRKHIEQNFHSVAGVMPHVLDLGVLGGSKTLAWGFAMAPHRLRILVYIVFRNVA